jgi:hypothetical protein
MANAPSGTDVWWDPTPEDEAKEVDELFSAPIEAGCAQLHFAWPLCCCCLCCLAQDYWEDAQLSACVAYLRSGPLKLPEFFPVDF